jgi:hypothetical protein
MMGSSDCGDALRKAHASAARAAAGTKLIDFIV